MSQRRSGHAALSPLVTACQASALTVLAPTSTEVSPTSQVTAPFLPSPTPFVRKFEVYPDQKRQTIAHIGSGNFIHYFGGVLTATDPHSELNLELLQPKFARVSVELQEWEPVNDNSDPAQINPTAFMDDQHNHVTFELMKLLQERGAELTASIWRVPGWLVEDANSESPYRIPASLYPEAIESISTWLLHARQQYGVDVAYVSFNEANLGVTVALSPQEYVEMIRIGGQKFVALGLKTKWLLGDCSNMGSCLEYVQSIYAAEDIRPYLGPLAFHNWDGAIVADETINALGDWAAQAGLEMRCTEGGWDAQLWQRPEAFPSYSNARQLVYSYNRTLKMSRATAFYYWEMMGNDYPLNDGSEPYLSMKLLRQLSDAFPPGTHIVETSPNGDTVAIVAGIQPSGKLAVHLVSITFAETIVLHGIPDGEYEVYFTERNGLAKNAQFMTVTDGTAQFSMPGFGVAILLQK